MKFQQSLLASKDNRSNTCNLWGLRRKNNGKFQFGIKAFNDFGEGYFTVTTSFYGCKFDPSKFYFTLKADFHQAK